MGANKQRARPLRGEFAHKFRINPRPARGVHKEEPRVGRGKSTKKKASKSRMPENPTQPGGPSSNQGEYPPTGAGAGPELEPEAAK
jgi:hypothetical protein